jgi:hypothetical protein
VPNTLHVVANKERGSSVEAVLATALHAGRHQPANLIHHSTFACTLLSGCATQAEQDLLTTPHLARRHMVPAVTLTLFLMASMIVCGGVGCVIRGCCVCGIASWVVIPIRVENPHQVGLREYRNHPQFCSECPNLGCVCALVVCPTHWLCSDIVTAYNTCRMCASRRVCTRHSERRRGGGAQSWCRL